MTLEFGIALLEVYLQEVSMIPSRVRIIKCRLIGLYCSRRFAHNVGALTVGGEFVAESAWPGMLTTGCDAEITENFNCGAVQPMTEVELRTTAQKLPVQPH